MLVAWLRLFAEEKNVCSPGQKLKRAQIVALLKGAKITHGKAPLHELRANTVGRVPAVRRAVHKYLDAEYRRRGRDFGAAFSYPELVKMPNGEMVPQCLLWDHGHSLKNARMASANSLKREAEAAAKAAKAAARAMSSAAVSAVVVANAAADAHGTGEGDGSGGGDDDGADPEEVDLFGDDETLDDARNHEEEVPVVSSKSDTLAHLVGKAAEDVIKKRPHLMHDKTMDPSHDPQHTRKAELLFSHDVADAMNDLGHGRAAAWVRACASEFQSYDKRGFSPAARWRARDAQDAMILDLHASLRWMPDRDKWVSPTTASIDGYSRVLIESYLISHDSGRALEVMLGPEASRLIYDRRMGSDLCESLFAQCVHRTLQDKPSKRTIDRQLSKIVRHTQRRTMDPLKRGYGLHASSNRVYDDKAHQPRFRCCTCSPPCVIGGRFSEGCACAASGRRRASMAKIAAGSGAGQESSIRNSFHKGSSSFADFASPAQPPAPLLITTPITNMDVAPRAAEEPSADDSDDDESRAIFSDEEIDKILDDPSLDGGADTSPPDELDPALDF